MKAAQNHLTRNMVFDLGPLNIRLNAVTQGAIRIAALATEIEKAMLKRTPLWQLRACCVRMRSRSML